MSRHSSPAVNHHRPRLLGRAFLPALGAAAALLLSACTGAAASQKAASSGSAGMGAASRAAVHKITAEEAKNMMTAGGVTIVDVRTQAEYDGGHVPGAIVVPVESIGDAMPAALPDKDATLLVYCHSGRRSAIASDKLAALGYQHVYDFGGIQDWPYDVVK